MRELVGCVGVPIVGGRQTTAVGQHSSTQKCSGGGTAAAAQQYSASCTCMALPRMTLSVPGSISSASDTSAGQAGSHATEMRQQVSWPVRQPYGETERPDPVSQPDRQTGRHSQQAFSSSSSSSSGGGSSSPMFTDLRPPPPPQSCALPGCPAASWSDPQTQGWAPGGARRRAGRPGRGDQE